MFAKYTYKANAAQGNVLNDIALLLTGTTNKALLSADCVQASTEIIAVNPAGWSLFDAAAGTNKKCLSAPCANGGTKYVVLSTATSGYVYLPLYESWNAVTHAGTNVTNGSETSTTMAPPVNLTLGGTLLIGATERYLVMSGYTAAGWMANGAVIIGEREPVDPWDTVAAGYPVSVHGTALSLATGGNYFYAPRLKGASSDYTGSSAIYCAATAALNSSGAPPCPTQMARDANFQPVYPLFPISLTGYHSSLGYVHQGGRLLGDLYATTSGVGTTGDELPVGADIYCIAKAGASAALAFPKF
ncbi:MAG: hypothetical protein EPN21_05120 [Methylococcaceae bacterium]|nr:MAG: hypothetical protein EPN21_05120 [Methylococcaceae bacterium]